MSNILTVKNLTKNYGNFNAVKNISFNVGKGEIFALIGPNGAGKSTTLKIIATILSKTSGEVMVNSLDIVKDQEKIRTQISYLPEEAGAYKRLSGRGYLQLMAGLYSDDKNDQEKFVLYAEEICNLGKRINDKIGTYSKGMTRKLILSRAIMTNPRLAILDEPTSGLDVINAIEIRNHIKEMSKNGMAVLLSSHNMLEIEYLSHRVAIIDKGKIYEIGTPNELKKKYKAQNLEEVFIKMTK